jgi:TRAP-type C4-dicarboxylate transport system permease small subunit
VTSVATGIFLAVLCGVLVSVGWFIARSNLSGKLLATGRIPGPPLTVELAPGRGVVQVLAYASHDSVAGRQLESDFRVSCHHRGRLMWDADLHIADRGRPGPQHEVVAVREFRPVAAGAYQFEVREGARQQIAFDELSLQVRSGKPRARRWVYVALLACCAVALAILLTTLRRG